MKNISEAFQAHLEGEYQTLAVLVRIARRDGVVLGFTDHGEDIVFQGTTYKAQNWVNASAVQNTASLSVDNLEIDGPLRADGINRADVIARRFDGCDLTVYLVNYQDPANQYVILRRGSLGEVTTRDLDWVATLRGLMQRYQQEIGELITPGCQAQLGDTRCRVDLSQYTEHGVVIAVDGRGRFAAELVERHYTDEGIPLHSNMYGISLSRWFQHGIMTWDKDLVETFSHGTDGEQLNHGLSVEVAQYEIESWAGEGNVPTFALVEPMPYVIQIGDKFRVSAGCDKSIGACVTKFNNVVNFRGFPWAPTGDQVEDYPDWRGV